MRAQGIDISHYQRGWEKQDHQTFCHQKISEGRNGNPFDFGLGEPGVIESLNETLIKTGYHYWRSKDNWQYQADAFYDALDVCRKEGIVFNGSTLDFEKRNNQPSKLSADGAKYWIDHVNMITEQHVFFYSSPSVIQEWMYWQDVYWAKEYENMMIAQWVSSNWYPEFEQIHIDTVKWNPRLAAGQTKWKYWQWGSESLYRGKYEGVNSPHVDLQVFNGTLTEMLQYFKKSDPETPEFSEDYISGFNSCRKEVVRLVDGMDVQ